MLHKRSTSTSMKRMMPEISPKSLFFSYAISKKPPRVDHKKPFASCVCASQLPAYRRSLMSENNINSRREQRFLLLLICFAQHKLKR